MAKGLVAMDTYDLRPATAEDETFLADLFYDVHVEELGMAGMPPAMLTQLLNIQYRGQQMSYASQFPQAANSIIWQQGERVGRLLVNEGPEEMRLVDISLLSSHRGKRLGTQILESLCARAAALQLPLRLSVRQGSAAQRLYLRCGFIATGHDPMRVEMEFRPAAIP